jgi:hypothetical protein
VRKQLDALRDRSQADTLVEVVRRALAVYDHLWAAKARGAKLVIRDQDGEQELFLL